jgi:hypothetical protein
VTWAKASALHALVPQVQAASGLSSHFPHQSRRAEPETQTFERPNANGWTSRGPSSDRLRRKGSELEQNPHSGAHSVPPRNASSGIFMAPLKPRLACEPRKREFYQGCVE